MSISFYIFIIALLSLVIFDGLVTIGLHATLAWTVGLAALFYVIVTFSKRQPRKP